jgi:hypothetical protein
VNNGHPGHDPRRHGRRSDDRDQQEPAIRQPGWFRDPVCPGRASRPGAEQPGEPPTSQLGTTIKGQNHQRHQENLARAGQQSDDPSRVGQAGQSIGNSGKQGVTRRSLKADRLVDRMRRADRSAPTGEMRLDRDDARRVLLLLILSPRAVTSMTFSRAFEDFSERGCANGFWPDPYRADGSFL